MMAMASDERQTAVPRTEPGKRLAAFLRGLLPETTQFDRQIAAIEEGMVERLARAAEAQYLWNSVDEASTVSGRVVADIIRSVAATVPG